MHFLSPGRDFAIVAVVVCICWLRQQLGCMHRLFAFSRALSGICDFAVVEYVCVSFFQQLGCKSRLFAFSCALSTFCDVAVVLCTCEFLPAIKLQMLLISARSGFRDVAIVVHL